MAVVVARKKSPRAPSMSLEDAVEKALRIYAKERKHAVPVEIVAQHLGYKDANNGAALSAMATMGYYGLLDRPKDGFLAVSKDVETYEYAPSEEIKRGIAACWLKTPAVFSDLLEKYKEGLPSDGTIKFDLIQRGFKPQTADGCVAAFRKSVEFAKFFENPKSVSVEEEEEEEEEDDEPLVPLPSLSLTGSTKAAVPPLSSSPPAVDRIPVRLSGGRRAWVEVPTPFYAADKERLKAQIELLLADDEDEVDD